MCGTISATRLLRPIRSRAIRSCGITVLDVVLTYDHLGFTILAFTFLPFGGRR